jgi:hypothetical protein
MLVSLVRCGHGGCIWPWDGAAGPVSTSSPHLFRKPPDAAPASTHRSADETALRAWPAPTRTFTQRTRTMGRKGAVRRHDGPVRRRRRHASSARSHTPSHAPSPAPRGDGPGGGPGASIDVSGPRSGEQGVPGPFHEHRGAADRPPSGTRRCGSCPTAAWEGRRPGTRALPVRQPAAGVAGRRPAAARRAGRHRPVRRRRDRDLPLDGARRRTPSAGPRRLARSPVPVVRLLRIETDHLAAELLGVRRPISSGRRCIGRGGAAGRCRSRYRRTPRADARSRGRWLTAHLPCRGQASRRRARRPRSPWRWPGRWPRQCQRSTCGPRKWSSPDRSCWSPHGTCSSTLRAPAVIGDRGLREQVGKRRHAAYAEVSDGGR